LLFSLPSHGGAVVANRIPSSRTETNLEQGFEAALNAVLERTWRAIENPVLPGADRGLRIIENEGLAFQDALRAALPLSMKLPIPAGLGSAATEHPALSSGEQISRSTNSRLLLSEKPLLPTGVKNALAFEQAFLVALLGSLKAVERSDGRTLGRLSLVVWEHGLPLTHVETTADRAVTVVAARPDPYLPGRGMGLAMVEHSSFPEEVVSQTARRDYRIHFHLMVPHLRLDGEDRKVFGLELSADR
jgi:hypothetical protein